MWDGCLASWNRRLNTRPGETPGLPSNLISAISSGLTPCRWVGFRMINSLLWRGSHEITTLSRSEERRVGEECASMSTSRRSPDHALTNVYSADPEQPL